MHKFPALVTTLTPTSDAVPNRRCRLCTSSYPQKPARKFVIDDATERRLMNAFLLFSDIVLAALVFILGFFVLGALRALGVLAWRLDQLEVTRPARPGRDGLKVGTRAPDFTLPSATGGEVSLRDFAGRKTLLVFTQG